MSYYTGTIFEIAIPQFGGSCGGGGRYDKMVGKFTGKDVPACGFSIGFERIILLMMENGFQIPGQPKKIAYLIEKRCIRRPPLRSDRTGTGGEKERRSDSGCAHEQKQEVPEGTADQRGLHRFRRVL